MKPICQERQPGFNEEVKKSTYNREKCPRKNLFNVYKPSEGKKERPVLIQGQKNYARQILVKKSSKKMSRNRLFQNLKGQKQQRKGVLSGIIDPPPTVTVCPQAATIIERQVICYDIPGIPGATRLLYGLKYPAISMRGTKTSITI